MSETDLEPPAAPLLTLLQARSFWSGSDLAERLEVTERTVRRDVDKLRSLGYPINPPVPGRRRR